MRVGVISIDVCPVKSPEDVVIVATVIKRCKSPLFCRREHNMKGSLNCLQGKVVQPVTYSDKIAQ